MVVPRWSIILDPVPPNARRLDAMTLSIRCALPSLALLLLAACGGGEQAAPPPQPPPAPAPVATAEPTPPPAPVAETPPPPPPKVPMAELQKKAILALNTTFNKHDAKGVAALYTPDGVFAVP